MCIVEIHEMDVISIKKAMTKGWKQTTTKRGSCQDFCFVAALKRAVLNGSAKCQFKIFLNFSYEEQLTISFISFWYYQAVDWSHRLGVCDISNNDSGILISWTLIFSILPITFRNDNSFTWRENLKVFIFTAIWVRVYYSRLRALCNFFRAISSPPPQVRRCPYAYASTVEVGKMPLSTQSQQRFLLMPLWKGNPDPNWQ